MKKLKSLFLINICNYYILDILSGTFRKFESDPGENSCMPETTSCKGLKFPIQSRGPWSFASNFSLLRQLHPND